jgi:hypothetical protein
MKKRSETAGNKEKKNLACVGVIRFYFSHVIEQRVWLGTEGSADQKRGELPPHDHRNLALPTSTTKNDLEN